MLPGPGQSRAQMHGTPAVAELLYDAAATRQLVAVYVTPDVEQQRAQFIAALDPQPGEDILDVGCGPGFLAESIAERIGCGGHVAGVDISEPLLQFARAHCLHPETVEYRPGDAIWLPYGDARFDAAACTQVLEYVGDVDAAISELRRVVRRGGRVVVVDTDWDSIVWHSSDDERMQRILRAWERHAPHPRLPRTLAARLCHAGFRVDGQQVLPLFNPRADSNTYSHRIIDLIVGFVVGRGATGQEAQAWAHELRRVDAQQPYFFSLNRYVFVATAM